MTPNEVRLAASQLFFTLSLWLFRRLSFEILFYLTNHILIGLLASAYTLMEGSMSNYLDQLIILLLVAGIGLLLSILLLYSFAILSHSLCAVGANSMYPMYMSAGGVSV